MIGPVGGRVDLLVLVRGVGVDELVYARVCEPALDPSTVIEFTALDLVCEADAVADLLADEDDALEVLTPAMPSGADGNVASVPGLSTPPPPLLAHATASAPTTTTARAA
jgi:hypothetical protein